MTVAIDNTFLTLFLNPNSEARPNPAIGEPTPYIKERIEDLIDELSAKREVLIIPSPCLAEVLSGLKDDRGVIEKLNGQRAIDICPFDQKCAIELADLVKRHRKKIKEIKANGGPTWQNTKMDMQIVAVAKVYGASAICTDDNSQGAFATLCGLEVKRTWDLPLSDERAQIVMSLEDGKNV